MWIWLLLIGLILQLIGGIGYWPNRNGIEMPVWVNWLIILGWIAILISFIYAWSDLGRLGM